MKTLCKYWPLFGSVPCPSTNSCWQRLQLSTPRSEETAHSLEESVASVDGEKEPLAKTREGRVTLQEREERTTQREFRLQPEVSEAVHCRENEDKERKPQPQIRGGGVVGQGQGDPGGPSQGPEWLYRMGCGWRKVWNGSLCKSLGDPPVLNQGTRA